MTKIKSIKSKKSNKKNEQGALRIYNSVEADLRISEALNALKNSPRFESLKKRRLGEFWLPEWPRAPFEEDFTFQFASEIDVDMLLKKRSFNGLKIDAFIQAIHRAVRGEPSMTKPVSKRALGTPIQFVGSSANEMSAQFDQIFGEPGKNVLDRIAPYSPRLVEHIQNYIAGELYQDATIDFRTRELCVIASLAAQGGLNEQLAVHVKTALAQGIRIDEIVSVIETVGVYAGIPRALNALFTAIQIFEEFQ